MPTLKFVGFAGLLAVLILGSSPPAAGQLIPIGEELQVNSYTSGDQSKPDLDATDAGSFTVVWQSEASAGDDDSLESIQGRRFSASGEALSGDFQVNSWTPFNQRMPRVAMDETGAFIVQYSSRDSDGFDSLWARSFDSAGLPTGADTVFYTADNSLVWITESAIDNRHNGGFVVALSTYINDYESLFRSSSLIVSTHDSSGKVQESHNPQGSEAEMFTRMSGDADTGFVVATQDASYYLGEKVTLRANRLEGDGSLVPGRIDIEVSDGFFDQSGFDVESSPDGGFLVVWAALDSFAVDDSETDIFGRRFDSANDPVGPFFQVNSVTTGEQEVPRIARAADGSFLVVWQSLGSSGDDEGWGIRGRRLDSGGLPVGDEIQVNSTTFGDQTDAAITTDASGQFFVAWQSATSSDDDASGSSIQLRRFATRSVFSDGFESGNTEAWSSHQSLLELPRQ